MSVCVRAKGSGGIEWRCVRRLPSVTTTFGGASRMSRGVSHRPRPPPLPLPSIFPLFSSQQH